MASYKITSDISTLGPEGGTVTDADLDAAGVDAALLIASNIIAHIPSTKSTTPEKD
jgi:formylmethanofuran dehydrogenase subunit B